MPLITVSRDAHGAMKLRPLTSFSFAASLPAVRVVMGELAEAQAHFPIVFVRESGAVIPYALMGLAERENLSVAPDGTWQGDYIPAMLRRYPFMLSWADKDKQDVILMVDDAQLSPTEGEPLFVPEGEGGPLKRALDALVSLELQATQTAALAASLAEHGLLEPLAGETAEGPQGRGMLSVNETKLKALPEEISLKLRESGALALAYAQVFSLARFGALRSRAAARRGLS